MGADIVDLMFRDRAANQFVSHTFCFVSVVLSHVCGLIFGVPFLEHKNGRRKKYAVALPTCIFDRLRIPKTSLHFLAENRVTLLYEISFR
jgi:hypothetical protein